MAAPAAQSLSGAGGSVGGSVGGAALKAGDVKAEHAGGLGRIVDELSEGFGRAAREATGEARDGLSDTRLVVQLGMLLGVLYLGFLSVWFWATRVRGGNAGALGEQDETDDQPDDHQDDEDPEPEFRLADRQPGDLPSARKRVRRLGCP